MWFFDIDGSGRFTGVEILLSGQNLQAQGFLAAANDCSAIAAKVGEYFHVAASATNPPTLSPLPPDSAPAPGNPRSEEGDPVDISTGLFVLNKTDFTLPDVMPLTLTRTYRTLDPAPRAFGIGATHSYDLYLQRNNLCGEVRLILPDGGRIRYLRTSGTNCYDSTLVHASSGTRFYHSTLMWDSTVQCWIVKLKDGTVYRFLAPDLGTVTLTPAPVTVPIVPPGAMLSDILDRYGNRVTIARDSALRITQITPPNGRWMKFSYDPTTPSRISQVQDNIGRIVRYAYDSGGRLSQVTDPENSVTTYTYGAAHGMTTIIDARGIIYLTNSYDANGRVTDQRLADGTYHFAYTTDVNGKIIQTDVTDPRGIIRRATFNSSGYTVTDTRALGQPEDQTLTYEWPQDGTNLLVSVTDALGRKTAYSYDAMGNVTSVTGLAGTPQTVTTSYTYEPLFNQLTGITDPLNHTTTYSYDAQGNLAGSSDALGNTMTFTSDAAGRPLSVTTPVGATSSFAYTGVDLTGTTDPLNHTTTRVRDGAGRLTGLNNPRGDSTRYAYDALNRLTQITDAVNGLTAFGYDANGNLTRVTDANNHTTSYAYDNMDRLQTRTDPLTKAETYGYDQSGNLTFFTDRKGQVTNITYDALNWRKVVTYADNSTTTYTWDKSNRLTKVVDSLSGTITRTYDDLDRLVQEVTPQGNVSYTYDAAGRRTSMAVAGQPQALYTYDAVNRLIGITQGTSTVSIAYDAAGRRTSLKLPNGIVVAYGYDVASQLTSLTYTQGGTTLGDLQYTYDLAGNRMKIDGTWARMGLPEPVASAGYDAANRQVSFGNTTLAYDANGNLTAATDPFGTGTYSWDARKRLSGTTAPGLTVSFAYDALGRRISKIVNSARTQFLYDGNDIAAEIQGGAITAFYLHSLNIDEPFVRISATCNEHYLTDALGATIALADPAGVVQTEYTYEPFGSTIASGAASTNPFQYTGRENDGTGLYYYRARYYSPVLSRFISEDPRINLNPWSCSARQRQLNPQAVKIRIPRDPIDMDLYVYARNNPLRFVDENGAQAGNRWDCPSCPQEADCNVSEDRQFVAPTEVCTPEKTNCVPFLSDARVVCTYSCQDKKQGQYSFTTVLPCSAVFGM